MDVHELEKGLNFDSETFQELRQSASFVLQRLLGNMVEKDVGEGKLTINIDVSFNKQNVPDYSPGAKKGDSRKAIKPAFAHKITSNFQMKDEKKGISIRKWRWCWMMILENLSCALLWTQSREACLTAIMKMCSEHRVM